MKTTEDRCRWLVEGAKSYAMILLDAEGRVQSWNAGAEQIIGWTEDEVVGRPADLIFTPEDCAAGVPAREIKTAAAEGRSLDLRWHSKKDGTRFFADGVLEALRGEDGKTCGFVKVLRDATEEGRRRERERFLAELAERTRGLTDPDAVITDAVRSIGEFLGVSRCIFADIDIEADTCTVHASEYRADPLAASIVGVVSIASFGAFVVSEYAARRAVVVDDVRLDSLRVPESSLAAYEAINIRAHVTVPVVHFDRVVSCMSIHSAAPRRWTAEEVDLLRTVVERTWLTVEVTRQERALRREAEERREAHERTARILENISDAFFTVDREWHYTYINSHVEALWGRRREDLLGLTVWEAWPEAVGSTFDVQFHRALSEGVPVSFEEFFPPLDAWLEVRVNPSPDGLSVFFQNVNTRKRSEESLRVSEERYRLLVESTGEGVYGIDLEGRFTFVNQAAARMLGYTQAQIIGQGGHSLIHHTRPDGAVYPESDCPIYHALHNVADFHVENDVFWRADGTSFPVSYHAAAILEGGKAHGAVVTFSDISERKAVEEERERLAERERTIAQQLQNALQPALPSRIPGLSLGSFTRPALDEASVGGDFFDVFPLDKDQYALVIGDVSGKGLAAAQQLALIRNSLRTTLYLYRNPAQAVSHLNAIVSAHDLLVGFVTAWAGVYDAATGQITYASCGHEPGLVRRAGDTVELLETTGLPLGVAQNADYGEMTITLLPGDSLLLYTDGISEAGLNRQELLGTAGLIRILTALPKRSDVQAQAEALVAEVSDRAGGIFRDDVAVLLACRE